MASLPALGDLSHLTPGQLRVEARVIVQHDPCSYCGYYTRSRKKRERIKKRNGGSKRNISTVDHIEPTTDGGENSYENMTGACLRCNNEKGHKSLLFFLLERLRPEEQ